MSKSHFAESVPAAGTGSKKPSGHVADHPMLSVSSCIEGDADALSAAAAAPSGDMSALSTTQATTALSKESAADIASDGSSSTATADGIILWSHMDKDKRVHLNDFLAKRYHAPRVDVAFSSNFDAATAG